MLVTPYMYTTHTLIYKYTPYIYIFIYIYIHHIYIHTFVYIYIYIHTIYIYMQPTTNTHLQMCSIYPFILFGNIASFQNISSLPCLAFSLKLKNAQRILKEENVWCLKIKTNMCTIYGAFFKNWCNSPLKEKTCLSNSKFILKTNTCLSWRSTSNWHETFFQETRSFKGCSIP